MDLHHIIDWLAAVFFVFIIILIIIATASPRIQNLYAKRKRKKAGEA